MTTYPCKQCGTPTPSGARADFEGLCGRCHDMKRLTLMRAQAKTHMERRAARSQGTA